MGTSELELPIHLYTEKMNPDGSVAGLNYSVEKLVAWADHGRGEAVGSFCAEKFKKENVTIEAWKEDQFLLLEETWLAVENGISDAENEAQYELACTAVRREAVEKVNTAGLKMDEQRSEIEKLVEQARGYISARQPAPQEGSGSGYLFMLIAVGVLGYVLLF